MEKRFELRTRKFVSNPQLAGWGGEGDSAKTKDGTGEKSEQFSIRRTVTKDGDEVEILPEENNEYELYAKFWQVQDYFRYRYRSTNIIRDAPDIQPQI
jgi:hypothetical protein